MNVSHPDLQMHDQSAMIAAHLEAMYPTYNIELVVMQAEDAYDANLISRLRAYGPISEVSAFQPSSSSVTVDLSKPGKLSLFNGLRRYWHPVAELPIASSSTNTESPLESLISLLQTLPSASHPHLLNNILTSLLHLASSHLPTIAQMLLGETSTRQAQNIIAGAAIGNGWGLPIELQGVYVLPKAVGAQAARMDAADSLPATRASSPVPGDFDHITRIKPLRESMIKEAAYYCHIRRIPTVNHRLWDRTIGSVGGLGGDKARMQGVGEARGKGGINSLEKLTEGMPGGISN
jgi:cytoplasmic tRNA 2-thiolation protein 2